MPPDAPRPPRPPSRVGSASSADVDPLVSRARSSGPSPPSTQHTMLLAPFSPPEAYRTASMPSLTSSAHSVTVSFASVPLPGSQILAAPLIQAGTPSICDTPALTSYDPPAADSPHAIASPSVLSSSSSMARAHQFMSFATDFGTSERSSCTPSVRGQGASAFLLPPPAVFVPMVAHGPEPGSDPPRRLDPVLAPPDHGTDLGPASAMSSDLDVSDLGEPIMSVPDGSEPILPDSNDATPGPRAIQWMTSRRREPSPGPPISDFPTDDDYVIPGTEVRRNRLVEWATTLWDQRPRANLSMVFQHIDSAWELVVHSRKNAISPVTLRFEKKRLNDKYNEHTMRIGEGPVRFLGLLLVIPVAVKLAFNSHQLVAMHIAASAVTRPWPSCLWGQVFVTSVSVVCMLAIVLMALASCYRHRDLRRRVVGTLGLVLYTILALGDLSALGLSFRCSLSGPSADMGGSGNALIVEDPNVSHHWSSSAGISLFMLVAASNLPFYHGIGISLVLALASVCLGVLIPASLSSRYWLIMMQAADHLIRGGLAMYQRELISRLTFILDIRLQAKQKSSTKKIATAPHSFAITSSIELSRALLNDHAAGDGAPFASPTLSVANLASGTSTRGMDANDDMRRTTSPPPTDASVTHPLNPAIEVTAMLRLPVAPATPAASAPVLDVPPMSTRPMASDSLVPDRSMISISHATAPHISMEFVDEAEQGDIDHVLLPALQLDAAGAPHAHGSVMSEDDRRSVGGLLPLGTLGRSHSFQDAPLPPPPLRILPDNASSPRPIGVRRRLSRHLSRTALGLDRDLAKSTDVVALRANGGSISKPPWVLGRVAKQKTSSNLLNTSSMVLSSIDLGKMTKLPTQRPVSVKLNEASAPPIIIATDEDGDTPHIIVNHEDVTSSCESDGMVSHSTGGRTSHLDSQDVSTFRLASPSSSVSRSVHDFLSTGSMTRNQVLDGSPSSVDQPHQAEGAAGPEETIDRDFDALHNSPMPPPPSPPPPPLSPPVLTLPTIMASPSPSPNSTLPSPLAAQTPITSIPATESLLGQPVASPSGPRPAVKRPKPGERTCCGRPVQELLRRPRHFFMYTFPSRADESNYRINYYRKLRTRFAITNVTSFLVWAVQAMIGTFVTIESSARDDQSRLVVDSWWFRYAPGLVVNLVPLWKLQFSPIQGPSLERFALFHVVLSCAVTIVLDAVRRYQTNDFSVLETSFHQINATVLAATTLRLRTRVHLPFLATVVSAFVIEWGILFALDREESLTPCLSVFFLATAVSATLSLFFESAARRYFLLRKLTMARPGRTRAGEPTDKTSPTRGRHGGAGGGGGGGGGGDQDSVHSKTSAVLRYARAEKMGQSLGINPHRVAAVAALTAHSAAQFLNPNHLVASASALDRADLPSRLRDRRVAIFADNPFRTVDSAGSVPLSPVSSNGIAGSGGSQFSGLLVGGSRADTSSRGSRPISNGGAGGAGGSTAEIRAEPLTRPVPQLASPLPASPPASVAPSSGVAKSERSIGAQRSNPQLPSLEVRSHHSGASDDDDGVDDAWLSVNSSFHHDDMPASGSRRASTERPEPAGGGVGGGSRLLTETWRVGGAT